MRARQAMAGLDINAPYSSAGGAHGADSGAETMTAGHKLSLEIVQHPHTPSAIKIEGVKATLERGLDTNARWREGRASGIVGATLLAAVLWLQGVSDDSKLELARRLLDQGLDVNSESVERATKASSGTFILAGAINCSSLQSESKARLLSMMVDAGLDLNSPCQQGKEASTTGSTLGARVAAAAGIKVDDQIAMLVTLVKGGWRPAGLSRSDQTKLANVATLLRNPALDPALRAALEQQLLQCDSGDWSWAQVQQAMGAAAGSFAAAAGSPSS